jgi:DNA-directed RNA polymerase specialized sigma24 family protein
LRKEENEINHEEEIKSEKSNVNIILLSTEEEKQLIEDYANKFMNVDYHNIIHWCYKWNGTNGKYFKAILPKDIVMNTLERVFEGKRKCYLKSYEHFRNSIYYHVKNELLTFFGNRNKDETNYYIEDSIDEESIELFFEKGLYVDGFEEIIGSCENQEFIDRIYKLFDEDKETLEIFVLEEILKGGKRSEIAKSLGISVNEVTNIQKRIKRKIGNNKNKLFKE